MFKYDLRYKLGETPDEYSLLQLKPLVLAATLAPTL